jgi:hypothetical protein
MAEKRYRVRGTIELNFEVEVSAESAEEAEEQAKDWAADGQGLSDPVGMPDVWEIKELTPDAR